jgi:hypothetical protein
MRLQSIGKGELRLEFGARGVIVACEPTSSGWWIYPIDTWRWEDGAPIDTGDWASMVQELRAAALDAGMTLDLGDLPKAFP